MNDRDRLLYEMQVRVAQLGVDNAGDFTGIVRNVYANNPGKLAAWLSASHVERSPKKKTPTP
jgi:hypothetical protein